jgi:S-adenosylmethionine/arginine decarboxylase-like enzyme
MALDMDKNLHWGKSASIDLHECSHDRLISRDILEQYVKELIDLIGMVAHGPCYIDRFGEGELEGFSAMQFIETSSVTVHLDEVGNRAFIDVFSCKDFDAAKAEAFSKEFFQASQSKMTVLDR